MTPIDTPAWAADFEVFQARFAGSFARRDPREQVVKSRPGLLSSVKRKNGWQIAAAVGDSDPPPPQRLLYSATGDADAVRDELQHSVVEQFGEADGIGVLDAPGFLKKGTKSVGGKRQYRGTAGQVANCQIGVLLSSVSPHGHAVLARRLYLPKAWGQDRARWDDAQVKEVPVQTKPPLGGAMLRHAGAPGGPRQWVTGDEVDGNAPALRALIAMHDGVPPVVAVSAKCPVWSTCPAVAVPTPQTGGRPYPTRRLAPDAPGASTGRAIVAAGPEAPWQRLPGAAGEQGLRTYDWAQGRGVESQRGLPGPTGWLWARRYGMSQAGFQRVDRDGIRPLPEYALEYVCLHTVIDRRSGAMATDKIDRLAAHASLLHGQSHGLFQASAVQVRSGNMCAVGAARMPEHKAERCDTTLPGSGSALQHHYTRPFSQQQATTPFIERPHFIPRQRPQTVKTTHDKATQNIHATSHHSGGRPGLEEIDAQPYAAGPRGTGCRQGNDGSGGSEPTCQMPCGAIIRSPGQGVQGVPLVQSTLRFSDTTEGAAYHRGEAAPGRWQLV
jgi:hypothetical protein